MGVVKKTADSITVYVLADDVKRFVHRFSFKNIEKYLVDIHESLSEYAY